MSIIYQNGFPIPKAGLRNSAATTLIAQQVWLLGTREVNEQYSGSTNPMNRIPGLHLPGPQKVPLPVLGQTQSFSQKQYTKELCAPYGKQAHCSYFIYAFTSRMAF
ncbi:hypothetical protein N7527_004863 [Penicillium freii]|nr:hypothetical protein N7527_004863 [Penicillium freii]